MNPIDKRRLVSHFGRRVGTYDEATPVQEQMAATLVGHARRHLAGRTVRRILELGCGTGRMTRQLAEVFPQAHIAALDISPAMIAYARTSATGIDFRVADAEAHVRHEQEQYDLIIANAAVQWFEDASATLKHARACLAADGLLAISTFGDQTLRELRYAFDRAYALSGLAAVDHVVAMRSAADWGREFPEAEIVEQTIFRVFADVKAFLSSVRSAGAVNSMSGRYFLPRRILRQMIDTYTTQFAAPAPGGITATYHIVYLYCKTTSNRK
jgi:malonyl-CoA O-methyltransferase